MDGLLCHCRVNPDGHESGSVLDCEAVKVKAGTRVGWPALRTYGGDYGQTRAMPTASGTCPDCGKNGVQVKRVETRGLHLTTGRPASVLQVAPGMATHKVKGAECSGTGQVPTETRYTPGRELAWWVRENGEVSVA